MIARGLIAGAIAIVVAATGCGRIGFDATGADTAADGALATIAAAEGCNSVPDVALGVRGTVSLAGATDDVQPLVPCLNGVEVIVLDRPNPLGGLKADGPLLDRELKSGVGAFRIPDVHGLTMGELARMAATTPGVLDVPEDVRAKGKLTVVPMRGWRRDMRWSETGLTFVPTSQLVPDFAAVMGYAMVGLGCEGNRFSHGLGAAYPYRGIAFPGKTPEQLQKDLSALRLPGLRFSKVSVSDRKGQPTTGVFVEVTDWADWNPTELSFHMMRLACRYDPPNPFAKLTEPQMRSFNIHVGSLAFGNALRVEGARIDVEGWIRRWREQARIYQAETKKYWLYQ